MLKFSHHLRVCIMLLISNVCALIENLVVRNMHGGGGMGSGLGGNQQSSGGMNSRDEAAALEAKLQMLKQDIAEKERLAQGVAPSSSSGHHHKDSSKRKPTKGQSSKDAKRSKGDKPE